MRSIDADKLEAKCKEVIAQEWNHKAAPVSWAHAYESFLDMLETAPTIDTQRWIPVTERLPDPFVSVLVQMPGEKPFPTVREGYISTGGNWFGGYVKREPDEVTHWMPMPEAPKEDEDEKV